MLESVREETAPLSEVCCQSVFGKVALKLACVSDALPPSSLRHVTLTTGPPCRPAPPLRLGNARLTLGRLGPGGLAATKLASPAARLGLVAALASLAGLGPTNHASGLALGFPAVPKLPRPRQIVADVAGHAGQFRAKVADQCSLCASPAMPPHPIAGSRGCTTPRPMHPANRPARDSRCFTGGACSLGVSRASCGLQ